MEWIDNELKKRQLPRAALVDVVPGMTAPKLSLVFSGQRKLSVQEADKIRRYFGYRLPEDPPRNEFEEISDKIQHLDDGNLHLVKMYIEALSSASPEEHKAS